MATPRMTATSAGIRRKVARMSFSLPMAGMGHYNNIILGFLPVSRNFFDFNGEQFMKKALLFALLAVAGRQAMAQNAPVDTRVFWAEHFNTGDLPDGWKNIDSSHKQLNWIVTNQPYPGSFEYQQQAPPIASKSRGYHLQFQAGYFVDEDQPSWVKKKEYPDTWVQTAPINCAGKSSVILRFQHTFRYNNAFAAPGAALLAGVSTDGIHWTDFNVMNNVPAANDMFIPINQELNITKIAAHQPQVYIRFYWKGFYSWYWMIDDIELAEGYKKDLALTRLTSHTEEKNTFTQADELAITVKNSGIDAIKSAFTVRCNIDQRPPVTVTVPANKKGLQPGQELSIKFPATDLTDRPMHNVAFVLQYPEDEHRANDSLRVHINANASHIGNVTGFQAAGANEFDIRAGLSAFKLIFYADDIFRLWMAPDGEFTDPAGNDIVVMNQPGKVTLSSSDKGAYYQVKSNSCVVRVYKQPLRFALYDITNTRAIWEESTPLTFGSVTTQTMKRQPDEYFYGGGMQNGYFSHRGQEILIEKGNGWDNGGRPNPAPFYMSTAGYGAFRNTFDVGKYDFRDTLQFKHNENRFDCFYFYGPSLKQILDGYTRVTGRPFLMPRWALSLGDANCYNRGGAGTDSKAYKGTGTTGTTPDVIKLVADKYIENDMPRGWILPNDGYGCGYTKLDSTIMELHKRGFYTGLWTENGVDKIAKEVGVYGSRLAKLDVAWVGPGYKFALDGCKAAYEGIENNSNARGYIWSVMGWAGTQRYSTVWSGDQSGNWEYIRFHIPTVIGAGLSAQNAATGDVDGIFRGSDSTYVRDLQWKCFTPVLMVMNGWAKKNKQPYLQGETNTATNRKYLQLKMRLTPYMYTLCADAHATGVPASRAMILEFPEDTVCRGTSTQYQFMNGPSLLVAPVYKSEGKRDSIYLPAGTWYDYWDGTAYTGATVLNNYNAPLDKLPLFVKQGAIIPMYPQMNYDGEKKTDTLTLDIYPAGKSSFDLYEDDGLTREYKNGVFARTMIEVDATQGTRITINAARGTYTGINKQRAYVLQVHRATAPKKVMVNGQAVKVYSSQPAFDKAATGCFFNASDKKGTLHIKTSYLDTATTQQIDIQ
ncbi:alpha-glucosidase (family GH31 glycosyl hydrolase) [Chitinophaga polysaccharea]|uniref:Alpha-glucosidase (Family GH31 glycosyl hydrolase) n=2 Tax=Chitinophaga polysaccharea TaxID=1293035 RepID=A0A561PTG0_9BACT|nr:alpha-glucosidase (family GH31 glycosyl hydrolase) [Chitinophaga polysaccharea]